jgi:predicted kinase
LPPGVPLCYKPFMRKWMREKLKRRKKTDVESAAPKPAPLQPAYFDGAPETAPPGAEPEPAPAEVEAAGEDAADASSGSETVSSGSETAAQPAGGGIQRPRRRRRGGRGRRRPDARPVGSPESNAPADVAAPVTPIAPSAPRSSKGVVVLAVGLPGSGKTTWFKRHNISPLSSDVLRSLLFDDPAEQRFQDLVFSNLRSMLKARLIARRPMNYVDATNLTPQERQNWIKLAKDFGYEVHAVFFDVPLEVCIERHQRRDRVVPEDIMRKMAAKLKAPTFDEGFAKITVVRVKQKTE